MTTDTTTTDTTTTGTTSPPRFTDRQRLVPLIPLGAGSMLSVDFAILHAALPQVGDGVGMGPVALPSGRHRPRPPRRRFQRNGGRSPQMAKTADLVRARPDDESAHFNRSTSARKHDRSR